MSVMEDFQIRQYQRTMAGLMRMIGCVSGASQANERLWAACVAGDILVVKAILDSGVDINGRMNPDGDTLLTRSIMSGQSKLACWLIDHGSDPNLSLYNGRTPLITAAGCGNLRVVDKLLSVGACVNQRMNNGATALMYAISKNQLIVAKRLVESGAEKSMVDDDGWTIADFAKLSGADISDL